MSDPARKHLAVPTADDGRAVAGLDTGAGVRQVRIDPLAHDFDEATDTLSPQLVVGRDPTKITSGEYAPDGRLVAGNLGELVRVFPRMEDTPRGSVTRDEADAALSTGPTGVSAIRGDALLETPEGLARIDGYLAAGGPPRSELDVEGQRGGVPSAGTTTGLITDVRLRGRDKALSMPVRYDGGGKPKERKVTHAPAGVESFYSSKSASASRYEVRQFTREVSQETGSSVSRLVREFEEWVWDGIFYSPAPAADQARALADRLNALATAYNDLLRKLSPLEKDAPERAALLETLKSTGALITAEGGFVPSLDVGDGVEGGFTEEAETDITAHEITEDTVEFWGSLDPYDPATKTHLDDSWRGKAYPPGLWAVHCLIDLDKLIGKPEPPPPEPPPPPENGDPPPFFPPPPGDEEEPKTEPKTNPQQKRIEAAYVIGGNGEDDEDALEVPSGGSVTTETIDAGEGELSPEKDGVYIVDGDGEDIIDFGGGDNDDPEDEDTPEPVTQCPIGGKRKPEKVEVIEVVGDHWWIKVYIDGVLMYASQDGPASGPPPASIYAGKGK